MKIIISPAKTMRIWTELMPCKTKPYFEAEALQIYSWLQSLSYKELKMLWKCSDKLCEENMTRLREIPFGAKEALLTPAIFAYEGIQYQYMSPKTMEADALSYLQKHLRILSGLYGVLRPFDGVVPYRLEMQAEASPIPGKKLYAFWGGRIYEGLKTREEEESLQEKKELIVNLASKEYAKAIEPYLTEQDDYLSCVFAVLEQGKLRQKATLAKMARGEMVRYMAEQGITGREDLKAFSRLGFSYSKEYSSEQSFVFVKEEI